VKFGQVYLEAWEIGQRHVVCLPLVLEAFHDFLVDLVVLIGIEILCELLRNVRVVVYWKSAVGLFYFRPFLYTNDYYTSRVVLGP